MVKMTKFMVAVIVMVMGFYHIHAVSVIKDNQQKKTYIVQMDKSSMPAIFDDHFQWYANSLKSVSESANMIYTYNSIINGFSTRLTNEEAKELETKHGILSVFPEMVYDLHTTRTPEFLGLRTRRPLLSQSSQVSDAIIGIVDTGVWPELESFNDTGFGPVPSTWKGICQEGTNFSSSNCNRKLIGARFFSSGYESLLGPIDESKESKSPRDDHGHGTHTSSTAAGSSVAGANLFGFASGMASGMAPNARIAIYKVCWLGGCSSTDILAGMEKAIEDGVNVLSLSLGGGVSEYFTDIIAIGAFAATEQGILVSCSAGNEGPDPKRISNVAPWITTIGAGTLDRDFPAYIKLGNGKNYSGLGIYSGKSLPNTLSPLIYGGNKSSRALCTSLSPEKVTGKIVICEGDVEKGARVKAAGGVGMILINSNTYIAKAHFLPTASIYPNTGNLIKTYVSTDPNPTATIVSGGTKLGIQPSPLVALFSSRGPNPITPKILKPDLIAPGVNILAGWSGAAGPSNLEIDDRRVKFNIISGTSMSCPHVSGLAALIKAAHPEWSAAAIRSALMTTAYTTYKNGQTIQEVVTGATSTPFDFGAGHVDPLSALDPGLIYDITVDDYFKFLCALNYTSHQIMLISKKRFKCDSGKNYRVEDLNYPSFAVPFQTTSTKRGSTGAQSTVKYTRTLTNVGNSSSTYKVSVISQFTAVKIMVEPELLSFNDINEKKTYNVTFVASSMPSGTTGFARLEWSDEKHVVGSPVAFSWT